MRKATRMLLLIAVVVQPALAAPVFRCLDSDGVPVYTDRICPGRGEALEPAALQPNVYTPEPLPVLAEEPAAITTEDEAPAGCNNADDLRHIDLMLRSLTTEKQQRRFLLAERKRVAGCQLARLSPAARKQRDVALARTRSLLEDARVAAEQEIEALYRQHRSRARER